MSALPLTILFFIDAASVRTGRYQQTIEHYNKQLRLADAVGYEQLHRPQAYVRLADAEKSKLPDVIDYLLDAEVNPLVVEDGAQLRRRTDLHRALDEQSIHNVPYLLLVKGDRRITMPGGQPLFGLFHAAVTTLHANKDVLTISVEPKMEFQVARQDVGDIYTVAPSPSDCFVVRARDLYHAALASAGQPAPFMGNPDAPALNILNAFSSHPCRHLAAKQAVAFSS